MAEAADANDADAVARLAWRFSGEKVVIPAHISGPTKDPSKPAGVRKTHALGYRIRDAKPPLSLPLPA